MAQQQLVVDLHCFKYSKHKDVDFFLYMIKDVNGDIRKAQVRMTIIPNIPTWYYASLRAAANRPVIDTSDNTGRRSPRSLATRAVDKTRKSIKIVIKAMTLKR